jgi:alpha-glucoside transport system substrate-binding protein
MSKFSKMLGVLVMFTLLLTACGGGQQTEAPATEAPTEVMTEAPTEVMTEAPTEAPTEAMTEAPTEAPTQAPVSGDIDCKGAQQGDEISMIYQWADVEEEALNQVLQPLVDACGIVLRPESTRDQALLDTRVQAGTPPDVAFWQVAQLVQYQDQLQDLEALGASRDSYSEFFLNPVTIDGKWLGLPIKADVKSIIWYSPANFEALGYEVPTTWEELDALVEQMVAESGWVSQLRLT